MDFKGKKNKVIALVIFIIVIIIILFVPDKKEENVNDTSADTLSEKNEVKEELKYLKSFAWYTDRGEDRYWFVFSPEDYPDEGENGSVVSFVEHLNIEMSDDDFNGRFTNYIYYDEIKFDDNIVTFSSEYAGTITNSYLLDKEKNRLIFSPVNGEEGEVIYKASPLEKLIYPVYTYGKLKGVGGEVK